MTSSLSCMMCGFLSGVARSSCRSAAGSVGSASAAEERVHLCGELVGVLEEEAMIGVGVDQESSGRDPFRERDRVLQRNHHVVLAVGDQRGDWDALQAIELG